MYSNSIETLLQSANLNALAIQKFLEASPDAKKELEEMIEILGKATEIGRDAKQAEDWYESESVLREAILEKIYTLQSLDEADLAENLNLDTVIKHTKKESGSFLMAVYKKFNGTDPRTKGFYANFKKTMSLDKMFGIGGSERRAKEAVVFKAEANRQMEKLREISQLLNLF